MSCTAWSGLYLMVDIMQIGIPGVFVLYGKLGPVPGFSGGVGVFCYTRDPTK